MTRKNFKLIIVTVVAVVISSIAHISAEDTLPSEYEVKAAFLFNFAKFVEWPEDAFSAPDAPIIFGILGEDPFGNALDVIKGKTVDGRKVMVKRFKDVKDIRVCHVLFISQSEKSHLLDILNSISHLSILTAGDAKTFAQYGGIINFITMDDKIRFEINIAAANRARLKISSQLLKLAKRIID